MLRFVQIRNNLEFVKKNQKRPILRGKIVLMTLFSKIELCNRSFMHYNKDTHKLNAQIITGDEAIQLRGLCKHKICNSFHEYEHCITISKLLYCVRDVP
jgi:hypothetical protein